nr:Tetratricopeptide TPR-1 domain containing protein [Haemonchus contortus]
MESAPPESEHNLLRVYVGFGGVFCMRTFVNPLSTPVNVRVEVSLANICHQAGLLHSALIAAGTALSASPNLVAIHFTIANIYASMGDYQRALEFYYSTLSLQMNFEPAKERIRAIYCHSGKTFDFQAV